jgi:hypothetical protein
MHSVLSVLLILVSLVKAPDTLVPQNGFSQVTSSDRKVSWSSDWGMQQTEVEKRRAVRFTENGTGRLSSFSREVRWSAEATWLADTDFQPVDIQKTVTATDGTPLLVERKHFDRIKGTVRFERRKGNGRLETSTLEIPTDTLVVEGLAAVLRFAPIDESHPLAAHVLSNEPRVYSVTFEWRGREHIKTPAGEFDCYKVEMVPHLGVMNLLRPFVTKTFFWFTVESPHNWVRYEGSENGPGTPSVVMELTRSR